MITRLKNLLLIGSVTVLTLGACGGEGDAPSR